MSGVQPNYEQLLFREGWLLAKRTVPLPPEWRTRSVGSGYQLSFPRAAPVSISRRWKLRVAVVGRPVDIAENSSDRSLIASRLADAAATGNLEQVLGDLAGRYVVVVVDGDGPRLYQDAAGTRAVFYRPGMAASHSALAADGGRLDGDVQRMWKKLSSTSQTVKYLPGIRAPHEGVRMLTPNTSLHVPSGEVTRYWPTDERIEVEDIELLADDISRMLTRIATRASAAWPLLCSLTAGIDSRLTLAACRGIAREIEFFSHIDPDQPNRTHAVDLAVAEDMADLLGLRHRIFWLGDRLRANGFDEFRRVWLANLGLPRGIPTLMKSYVDEWPDSALHLRSNVAEIGRVFYKGPRLDGITPAGLAHWWNPDLESDADVLSSFREFCDIAQFNDHTMAGYDPLDLFYWEHRMGSWHAWLCLESDVAHDTFPIYSNRNVLTTMLAAPFERRNEATVFHRAIGRLWPELTEWPINPKQWSSRRERKSPAP